MSVELRSPFFGVPLKCTVFGARNRGDYAYLRGVTRKLSKKGFNIPSCKCAKKLDWIFQGSKLMHSCGKNVELYWKKLELQSGQMINSVKGPIARSRSLVKVMTPVWEEGLFLFRCSVFFAVISGVCLLMWYGQSKAKVYIEANLMPSVCTLLSDHLQRELDFGKVRRISPLSITLESCSIGPHREEFSCGEVPTVKLRIRPFASLRRGKIVVDAVLSNPSLLVAQKKNYTWLGIPYSEGSLQRHLSAEEGIDYRTRTRRIAREEAALRWERERDDAARMSAEKGYVISECNSVLPEEDPTEERTALLSRWGTLDPFLYMDEKLHWKDHHCMDAGAEYDSKHADLERSFGAKVLSPETSIWSRIMPVSMGHKFKRNVNGRDLSMLGIASKRRLLECSASAARLFFEGQSLGKSGNSTKAAGFDSHNMDISPMISRDAAASVSAVAKSEGGEPVKNKDPKFDKTVHSRKVKVAQDELTNMVSSEVEIKSGTDYVSRAILEIPPRNKMNSLRDPFLITLARISKSINSNDKTSSVSSVVGIGGTSNCPTSNKNLEGNDTIMSDVRNETIGSVEEVRNNQNDNLDTQDAHASGSYGTELESSSSANFSEQNLALGPQSGLSSAFNNFCDAWSCILVNPLRRLKSEIGKGVENITTEIVDEVAEEKSSGIDKMIPLVLDSVHFKGGTLMLLAYGDTEPREMEVASGHVKFQNHYGRVHVQLSGNCKMWRSDLISEDGGWLSTDVYVDIIEQKWHANLRIANLFIPLFERILDLPIAWSKGRASGEVLL